MTANRDHPLVESRIRLVLPDETDDPGLTADLTHHLMFFPGLDESSAAADRGDEVGPDALPPDPNDRLVTIAGPILAGFALAAVVVIGTGAVTPRDANAAAVLFAGSAVLLLFAIQMLAVAMLPGLRGAWWPRLVKGALYETGLLAFLAGLWTFLWPRSWSATAVVGLAIVGFAVMADLALLGTIRYRRRWYQRAAAQNQRARGDAD